MKSRKTRQMGRGIFVALAIALVALGIGFIMGYFLHPGVSDGDQNRLKTLDKLTDDGYFTQDVRQILIDEIKAENIRSNSKHLVSFYEQRKLFGPKVGFIWNLINHYQRFLSSKPHIAGTPRSKELAEYMQKTWREQGLENVKLVPYNIFLTYPNNSNPNKVSIIDNKKVTQFTASIREDVLREEDNDPDFLLPFHAYSPNGKVEGDLVYVNYGRVQDFETLRNLGVKVAGKIVLCRYGKVFRGNKVTNSFNEGAIGVIMYSDPSDVAIKGTGPNDVYPNSWWLQESGMQRGNVFLENGDPLTPYYPSNEYSYRIPIEKAHLGPIPSQPIGYRDARELLSWLEGSEAPEAWRGKLNITYRTGPGFRNSRLNWKIKLEVNNYFTTRTVYNVIGSIAGKVEPDRYVIIGNHRDAWGFGAVDAVSGTAALLEITRSFGLLKRKGWQPRRTLIFCSWDAEEFAIIGSQEWAEDFKFRLSERAVAYVNIDVCSMGCTFKTAASPILKQVIYHVSKQIPDPVVPQNTIYDEWKKFTNSTKGNPNIPTLGSGSDYGPFVLFLGVPAIDYFWSMDTVKFPIDMYPAYHSAYDSFHLVDKYTDPGFKCHQGCGRISAETLRYLADSFLLPFDVRDYAIAIFETIDKLKNSSGEILSKKGIKLDILENSANNFSECAQQFHQMLDNLDKSDPIAVRRINDLLMKVERAFILPTGLPPGRPLKRHILFAPSMYDSYASKGFPGIADLLYNIENEPDANQKWEDLKRHLAEIIHMIQSAADFLKPVEDV